jgi:hypothetical protein
VRNYPFLLTCGGKSDTIKKKLHKKEVGRYNETNDSKTAKPSVGVFTVAGIAGNSSVGRGIAA